MNRRYKHSKPHHHLQQSNMFLPIMICSRSSVKDVKLSHSRRRSSNDTSSPKIGCSGQVKRNNKVTGFPTPNHHHHHNALNFSSSAAVIKADHASNVNTVKYQKLGRPFSTKTPTTRSTANDSGLATAKLGREINSCYLRKRNYNTCNVRSKCGDDNRCKIGTGLDSEPAKPVNVAELDPPLPVVRRPAWRELGSGGCGEEERESLWKRRSRGAPLTSLQVQSIHGGATRLHSVAANTV